MKLPISILLLLFSTLISYGQSAQADKVLGRWYMLEKEAEVEVFKENGKYFAKITKVTRAEKLDVNNPDEAKRSLPREGLVFVKDLQYGKNRTWKKGSIYDPDNGKSYRVMMEMKNFNTLKVTGYLMIPTFGKTFTWKRVGDNG